jgi:hypothetical protein
MIGVPQQQSDRAKKGTSGASVAQLPAGFGGVRDNLVSCAGLVPVMTLAEQTGLSDLLTEKVCITESRIKSGAANLAPKLAP